MKKINFSVKDKKKLIDCNKIEIFKTSFLKEQIMHIVDNINKHQYQYKNENKNYYLEHIDKNISELLKENKIYLKKNTKVYIYIIILLYLYISFRENLTNVYYFIIAVQKIFIYKEIKENNYMINNKEIIIKSLNILIIIFAIIGNNEYSKSRIKNKISEVLNIF